MADDTGVTSQGSRCTYIVYHANTTYTHQSWEAAASPDVLLLRLRQGYSTAVSTWWTEENTSTLIKMQAIFNFLSLASVISWFPFPSSMYSSIFRLYALQQYFVTAPSLLSLRSRERGLNPWQHTKYSVVCLTVLLYWVPAAVVADIYIIILCRKTEHGDGSHLAGTHSSSMMYDMIRNNEINTPIEKETNDHADVAGPWPTHSTALRIHMHMPCGAIVLYTIKIVRLPYIYMIWQVDSVIRCCGVCGCSKISES